MTNFCTKYKLSYWDLLIILIIPMQNLIRDGQKAIHESRVCAGSKMKIDITSVTKILLTQKSAIF